MRRLFAAAIIAALACVISTAARAQVFWGTALSSDGTIVNGGTSGYITNLSGTFTLGAGPDGNGNYPVILSGVAQSGQAAAQLYVVSGSTYQLTGPGVWWQWSVSGNAWVGPVSDPRTSMAFNNHAADLGVATSSPLTVSYTPVANTNLLEVCVEFSPGASPTVTYGGNGMTLPSGGVAAAGGNNQLAMYYLFNPAAGAHNVVVTRAGAGWLNAVAADYNTPSATFDGATNSTQGTPNNTYSANVTVPTANDWVVSCSNNVGSGSVTDSVASPNVLRVQSSPNRQNVLADSAVGVAAGPYNISVTIGDDNGGGAVSQTRVVHFFPGGPPPVPTVTAVGLNGVFTGPFNFQTPASGTLFTLSASCSPGSCSGATFSLPSVATTGCSSAQIAQNANFTISGSNLNAVGTISGTPTENIGIVVNLAGATNNGQCFPVVLNGSTPFVTSLTCSPTSIAIVDTTPLHTAVCTLVPVVSSGSFTGTYSIVSCSNINPCPLELSGTGPGAVVQTALSPPLTDRTGSQNIVISASQPNFFTPIAGDASYHLVFDDEFNGAALDTTSNWFPPVNQVDNTYSGYSPALTVNETTGNVSVHDGCLDLAAGFVNSTSYTSSIINTRGSITGPGVYYEARVKIANPGSPGGLSNNVWTDQSPGFGPMEIDWFEYQDPNGKTTNGWNPGTGFVPLNGTTVINPYGPWHYFASWWTASALTFYIDGVQTRQETSGVNQATSTWYAITGNSICSQAICGGQPGGSSAGFPAHFLVDYIHVYATGGTPISPQANYGGPGDMVGSSTCTN